MLVVQVRSWVGVQWGPATKYLRAPHVDDCPPRLGESLSLLFVGKVVVEDLHSPGIGMVDMGKSCRNSDTDDFIVLLPFDGGLGVFPPLPTNQVGKRFHVSGTGPVVLVSKAGASNSHCGMESPYTCFNSSLTSE